ncbi:MAG TPA: hypothetical protein VGG72_25625 [Bryobacteraceae bacterium]|jgi:hypothetical protein
MLTRTTIAKILAVPSPQIHRDVTGASFSILCTVEEGVACRFAGSDWTDASLAPLALSIVDELGWNRIDRAPRRQVMLRGFAPDGDPARARCECDAGNGYIQIEVTE